MTDDDIERRLADIARRTASITARSGFSQTVAQRLAEQRALGYEQLFARDARRIVFAATLLALIAVAASLTSQHALDSSLATGIDTLEGEW